MTGTIVNSAAIIAGSGIGILIHSRLPEKYQKSIFNGMGLVTIVLGSSMALQTQNFLVVVISIVLGSILGQLIDIEKNIKRLMKTIAGRYGDDRSTQGFVTSSLLFCVGSMAILGAIEDGQGHTPTLLYTKSVMDGTVSIAFAATFGLSVMFSAIPVFVYQGAITLLAAYMANIMIPEATTEMAAVGGILLIGLGITILKIKEINVTNMLPSLIFAIIFAYILQ